LGNVYLETNKWKEAEIVFIKDLNYNNENGWALYGLYQAFLGQKKIQKRIKYCPGLRKHLVRQM